MPRSVVAGDKSVAESLEVFECQPLAGAAEYVTGVRCR